MSDPIDRQAAIDALSTPHGILYPIRTIENMPSVQPERKKDAIQKFHDYQVEWLLSHCDLELEPQLEEWVVRFLHDTANCYMMEIDREER